MEHDCNVIEWIAFASNVFNVLVPFMQILMRPRITFAIPQMRFSDNFTGRANDAAMADASYRSSVFHIERYKEHVLARS